MLQLLLLVAIAAGSTRLFAKKFFSFSKEVENCDKQSQEDEPEAHAALQYPPVPTSQEPKFFVKEEAGIFRFSSSESRNGLENLRRKSRNAFREINKLGHRSGGLIDSVERKRTRRRFFISLSRRLNRNVTRNPGSSSNDNSLFEFGLGIAILYMMSAGKYELNKLNKAIDETAKVVQELQSKLHKRKSSRNLQISSSATDIITNSKNISGSKHLVKESERIKDSNDVKGSSPSVTDDGECASSVVTEEDKEEMLDMDQLQAELESELQKLSWNDAPYDEGTRLNLDEIEVSAEGFHEIEVKSPDSYKLHGVVASELKQKLCHVLIQQQESHIVELESDLHIAQSKLHERETELQALKECVRCLTQFSPLSDDELNANEAQNCTGPWDYSNAIRTESRKSVIGMKRPNR